jgi:hypothetical protein
MGNQVFANNMEVSCKAANGKSICAFPDVCFTPPTTPATPPGVPIPYPNTGMASDCTDGSSTVKVSGQEVMLKNKSYFKKSTGDEAGSAPKKGVVTSKNMGKVYFTMWSMDVKVEGENVVRHLDMTTHNHASMPSNTSPWPYIDEMSVFLRTGPCAKEIQEEHEACFDCQPRGSEDPCQNEECQAARKCKLEPYGGTGSPNCCDGDTAHHLVEVHCFAPIGQRRKVMSEFTGYNLNDAPCVCASGPRDDKEHGSCHAVQGQLERAYNNAPNAPNAPLSSGVSNWTYGQARDVGLMAHRLTFPASNCSPDCIAAQLDSYHTQASPDGPGVNENTPVRSDLGTRSEGDLSNAAQAEVDVAAGWVASPGL